MLRLIAKLCHQYLGSLGHQQEAVKHAGPAIAKAGRGWWEGRGFRNPGSGLLLRLAAGLAPASAGSGRGVLRAAWRG